MQIYTKNHKGAVFKAIKYVQSKCCFCINKQYYDFQL